MKTWVKIFLAVIVAALGISGLVALVKTKPQAAKKERERVLPAVEVVTAQSGEYPVTVATQGEVMARRETAIAAEVTGRVLNVAPNFEVGERFQEGEFLLQIDEADYRAASAKAASDVESAKLKIATENALAAQAERDWKALGKGREPTDLVLRKPQLASAEAALSAAAAALEKAERDLQRTKVRAPYACQIKSTRAELGAVVSAGTPIAEVFSADDFELRLPVSLEDYTFVDAKPGVPVTFEAEFAGEVMSWKGELIRSEGQVDRESRSVFLVAKVSSPVRGSAEGKFLAPGLFLKAGVTGKTLQGVFRLPRKALYGKDKLLIVNPDNTVSLRPVKVVRTEADEVVIGGGLEAGERVAVSPLPNVIDGMEVMIAGQKDAEVEEDDKPEGT